MGDYLENGKKIGTCGVAHYATKKQLEAVRQGQEVAYYLNPENRCTFAFPHLEYERKQAGDISNYHEEEAACLVVTVPEDWKSHHKQAISYKSAKNVPTMVAFATCPNTSNSDQYVYLTHQRFVDGKLNAVVTCPYCKGQSYLTPEEAEVLAIQLEEREGGSDDVKRYRHAAKELRETYTDKSWRSSKK